MVLKGYAFRPSSTHLLHSSLNILLGKHLSFLFELLEKCGFHFANGAFEVV